MAKTAKKKAPAKAAAPEVVEQPTPAVQEPVAEEGAQLTIADLQAIAQVIDMAVRRGAFGASEVSEVGAIYGKLANFLQIIAAQTKEAEGTQ
jgi:hypothetical protein